MIDVINKLISKLTIYGGRCSMIESEPFSIINWSNASAEWYLTNPNSPFFKSQKKGDVIELDANQTIVPFEHDEVKKIIHKLDDLPLYKNSFEVKMKR